MTRYELAVVVALRDGTDAVDVRPSGRGSHRMSNRRRAESGRFETLKDFEWLAGVMGKGVPSRPARRRGGPSCIMTFGTCARAATTDDDR